LKKEDTSDNPEPNSKKDKFGWGTLGMFVWAILFFTLVSAPAQYPTVHSQMAAARLWHFKADMDHNGVVTISDTWLWFKWLFFFPGDSLIVGLMKFGDIVTFFELSASSFGNWFSWIISFAFWSVHILIVVLIFLNRFLNRYER
jgi:hypothetical protein